MAYPLLIGFSSIPKVAVVPIFVLWFGAGTVPAILTAITLAFFPIVVNVATGLATTEPELEDVMKAMKASKLDILLNVGLPRAMPYFFASLKVAVTQAFVGTVIAETVADYPADPDRELARLRVVTTTPVLEAGLGRVFAGFERLVRPFAAERMKTEEDARAPRLVAAAAVAAFRVGLEMWVASEASRDLADLIIGNLDELTAGIREIAA